MPCRSRALDDTAIFWLIALMPSFKKKSTQDIAAKKTEAKTTKVKMDKAAKVKTANTKKASEELVEFGMG